jgi:hypothetical protein
MLVRALLVHIAHETAGAARIRHSLRPLNSEGKEISGKPRAQIASRDRETVFFVIASAAKQSMAPHEERKEWIASLRSQ